MQSATPFISVVIPTYNRSDTIARAIYSVLAQTSNFEIIVVDDASTDNTLDVLSAIPDQRIRVIPIPHGGVATARNHALSVARGEWIAFLDSDDWWHPEKIATVLPFLTAEFDVIGHDCVVENSTTNAAINCGWKQSKLSPLSLFFLSNRIATSAVVIRRAILQAETGPFDSHFSPAEDYELWARLAARGGRFHFVPRPLTHYYTHNGQLTSNPVASYTSEINVVQACAQRWGSTICHEIGSSRYNKRLYEGRIKLAFYYLRIGNRTAALGTLNGIPPHRAPQKLLPQFFAGNGYAFYTLLRNLKRSRSAKA